MSVFRGELTMSIFFDGIHIFKESEKNWMEIKKNKSFKRIEEKINN